MRNLQQKSSNFSKIAEVVLILMLLVAALFYIGGYGYLSYKTLAFPYFLEWAEGNMFLEAVRIKNGLPVYSKPSLEYVPNLYTPLYFYVVAAFTYIAGNDFFAGRVVSFLSTVLLCVIIYNFLRKEKVSRGFSFIAAGFYLATYGYIEGWFNLVRVDSLFLLLMFSGLFFLRHGKELTGSIVSAILFSLAVFTKQQALIVIGFILLGHIFSMPRRAVISGGIFFLISLIAVGIFEYSSEGWFLFYTWELPQLHAVAEHSLEFYSKYLGLFIPAYLLVLYFFIIEFKKNWKEVIAWCSIIFSGAVASYMGIRHAGGFVNNLMPLYLLICIGAAKALSEIRIHYVQQKAVFILALLVANIQIFTLAYNPAQFIPSQRNSLDYYMEYIKNLDGKVLVSDFNFIETNAGKKFYGSGSAAEDIFRIEGEHPVKSYYTLLFNQAIYNKEFDTIISAYYSSYLVEGNKYIYLGELTPKNEGYPLSGHQIRPIHLFKANR